MQSNLSQATANTVRIPWRCWYGNESLELAFPDRWSVESVPPQDAADVTDKQIRDALSQPIGTPTIPELAKGKKTVAIAVDDLTRPTQAHRIVPILLEKLHESDIADDNIIFVMALGAHRIMLREDLEKKLGKPIVDGYAIYNHHTHENLVSFGKTGLGTPVMVNRFFAEAELKIGIGFLSPHLLAGFGGGAKIVLPGLCGIETLEANHGAGFAGRFKSGLAMIEGNVLRADLEDTARRVGLDLVVNCVGNSSGATAGVFAGDLVKAHRAAVEMARRVYATQVPQGADIGIFNSFPKDTDMVQCTNALNLWQDSEIPLVKEGGVVIIATAGSEGKGYHGLSGKGMRLDTHKVKRNQHLARILQTRRRVLFCPTVNRYDVHDFFVWDMELFTRWGDLVAELSKSYPDTCRVVVFPCSTLQCPAT